MKNSYRQRIQDPKILTTKQQVMVGAIIGLTLAGWSFACFLLMWGAFG